MALPLIMYHIADPGAWADAQITGRYVHPSLNKEGFIHFSLAHQVNGTTIRYFAGHTSILVLKVRTRLLTCELRLEPSTSGEIFPHLYGELNTSSVVDVRRFDKNGDAFVFDLSDPFFLDQE